MCLIIGMRGSVYVNNLTVKNKGIEMVSLKEFQKNKEYIDTNQYLTNWRICINEIFYIKHSKGRIILNDIPDHV